MYTTTITNPKTNRTNRVKVWTISGKDATDTLVKHGAKVLGLNLLDGTIAQMEEDSASVTRMENFALSAFENALDWGLGIVVSNYILAFNRKYPGKRPAVIRVAANRNGDCFILSKDGAIIM